MSSSSFLAPPFGLFRVVRLCALEYQLKTVSFSLSFSCYFDWFESTKLLVLSTASTRLASEAKCSLTLSHSLSFSQLTLSRQCSFRSHPVHVVFLLTGILCLFHFSPHPFPSPEVSHLHHPSLPLSPPVFHCSTRSHQVCLFCLMNYVKHIQTHTN